MTMGPRGTEEGTEGLEGDPGGTMPKVTRKNAVRRATKTHEFTPPVPPPTLFAALLATDIRENLLHCVALHHAGIFAS